MIRRPPRSTRTDTLFPYTTLFRSTDEEAFRVSDVENRSRKDITDWERGIEYSRALAEFYNGSQNEMAEHLKISRSWLSRLLDVVRLPEAIIAAFADRHDITVRSEERRVGKECVSTCRSRWSPYH